MNKRNVKRKLAALVSADVVGYSRLMGDDEMGTVFLVMESILPHAWRVWLRRVAFASLGGALIFSGLPEKALGYIEKAIRLNPNYPEYYIFTLGQAFFQLKMYEEALMALRKSIIKNPNLMPAHYVFAACYALHHMDGGRFLEPEMSTRRA